jgi:hypothetical protein
MMSQGVGVWYECPIIMNTAAEVCEVCSKFDQRCLKSIKEDHNDQGGFKGICRAHKLIEKCIWTCRTYHEVV